MKGTPVSRSRKLPQGFGPPSRHKTSEGDTYSTIPENIRPASRRALSITDFVAIAGFGLSISSLVISIDANRKTNLTSYRTIIYQARVNSFNSYPRAAMKFEAALRKAMLIIPFRVEDKKIIEVMGVAQWQYTSAKVNFMIDAYEEFLQEVGTSGYNWPVDVRKSLARPYVAARNVVNCFTIIGSRPEQSDPKWWKEVANQSIKSCGQIQDRSARGPAMVFFASWRHARDEMLNNLQDVADNPEHVIHQEVSNVSDGYDLW